MEEKAVTNGAAAADVAAPDNKDNTKEEVSKSKEPVANKDAEEQNKGSENGAEGHSGGDVNMAEAEITEEGGGGDAGAAKQVDSGDVKTDADTKEDANARTEEGEDAKMTEADVGSTEVKDKEEKEDEVENTNEQDESKEQEKGASAEQEENEGKETDADENQEEEEAEEKGSADKKDEAEAEGDKKTEENKETPKNKKARSARDRSQGKDKEQDGSKSKEAKSLLNTPSPYGTNRPQRERKTVERLVEVIDKEPNKNFVVEKGQGTPLKDIPSVAHRISRKKPSDLKFLHSILFGRKGKAVDFKGHILQFSGFVWHESDEKQRAKAKEKLDKCVKDTLLDLCWTLGIPTPKANIRKEDIVSKLLDFIAEPHSAAESWGSDDQGSNSKKRKRGGESASKTPDGTPSRSRKKFVDDGTSSKRQNKALQYDTEEDESMKSDSEENIDEDSDEAADKQEVDYGSGKEKAGKKLSEVKESSGKKKSNTGSGHKSGPPNKIIKNLVKKVSSKIHEEKESPNGSAKVFSRKKKPTAEKEIKEKKSSGKKVTKGKGESAEAVLPSKDDLRKTITEILKKVDFNTATFSDILKKLDNHYKMDLTPKKEAIKVMIQDELTKLSEEDEGEGDEDTGKKQQQPQAQEIEA